jgi:hypothetical protein
MGRRNLKFEDAKEPYEKEKFRAMNDIIGTPCNFVPNPMPWETKRGTCNKQLRSEMLSRPT